jgi:hypothetical protein
VKRVSLLLSILAGLAVAGVLASALGAAEPPAAIPDGVTIGGVPVGGLTPEAAVSAVQQGFETPLEIQLRSTRILVTPDILGATPVVDKAIERALIAEPNSVIPLGVSVVPGAPAAFIAKLAKRYDRPAVDAKLFLRQLRPWLSKERAGLKLDRRTGQHQYPTPLGRFSIVVKWKNPWWYPPDSPWAAGQDPVPPGPGNPLGTRWMGLSSPGVGIHGTPSDGSIGYSVSHGCIRMHIPQAEWLFNHVEIGTTVFIVAS